MEKVFSHTKIEVLCPSLLKSKSACIKCVISALSSQMSSQSASFTWVVCVYSLVLACKLCFMTFMICDLLMSILWNFCPEWMKLSHRIKLTSSKDWGILLSLLFNLADLCSLVMLHQLIVYILPTAWIGFESQVQIEYSACNCTLPVSVLKHKNEGSFIILISRSEIEAKEKGSDLPNVIMVDCVWHYPFWSLK